MKIDRSLGDIMDNSQHKEMPAISTGDIALLMLAAGKTAFHVIVNRLRKTTEHLEKATIDEYRVQTGDTERTPEDFDSSREFMTILLRETISQIELMEEEVLREVHKAASMSLTKFHDDAMAEEKLAAALADIKNMPKA
jgi:hypothetical protein